MAVSLWLTVMSAQMFASRLSLDAVLVIKALTVSPRLTAMGGGKAAFASGTNLATGVSTKLSQTPSFSFYGFVC
jgi:hypothetical protein